jgi:redox-sensitive bicupin YhaK (pirin superfamily)
MTNTDKANSNSSLRSVSSVIPATQTLEGAGFIVNRPFPSRVLRQLDPFLLLDEMGPMNVKPGEAKGAPDHPHRGFETVTYMLSGAFEHHDSSGHSGKLRPGDVQWMTAGSGVVHSEMPAKEFVNTGGKMHGFQLWVNLPKKDKMARPHYQEIPSSRIPIAKSQDGKVTVRMIAGDSLDKHAKIETKTPIMYLHITLEPGAEFVQPVPTDYNLFAYVIEGMGYFGQDKTRVTKNHQMVIFDKDGGDSAYIHADEKTPLEILLIGGVPINEPVARYGPFVMNTEEEISQAIQDYQQGKMGIISS